MIFFVFSNSSISIVELVVEVAVIIIKAFFIIKVREKKCSRELSQPLSSIMPP